MFLKYPDNRTTHPGEPAVSSHIRDIAECLVSGYQRKELSALLGCSEYTLSNAIYLLRKYLPDLKLRNSTMAFRAALKRSFVLTQDGYVSTAVLKAEDEHQQVLAKRETW